MIQLIQQQSKQILDEVIAIRRHIHQHPELSFHEYETSKFVASKLSDWGIDFKSGIVETGIVALIKPESPSNKCIGLRADLDALPIKEENDVAYKSCNEGIMHACGHDVHTAILLGTAKILQENRDKLHCSVKLIFQPGEEKLPGGASLMIKEGVLQNPKVDEIYALHVFPELEAGKIGLKEGMYMASTDEIYITVHGKGGHGAMPHQNIDPILISAHLLTSLQQIVSRNCPPQIPCVLSFGRIEGLGATNVIPDKVDLQGTFRTMDESWRDKAHTLIKNHSIQLVEAMGGKVDVEIRRGYPFLENNPELTKKARQKATEVLGSENVTDLPLRLTAEDFAYFSQEIPATFIRIGVRNESKGIIHPVHNAKFDIDETAMQTGIQTLLAQILL
ncbi:M20 family metallopeptidase [Paracrocinitomix mangrovi]|uniref:M20 metallopeptidase family protein n=1 Tax=Paracrocinitomix mangrovi TaxID=2862509 RepID=UPI001C8EB5BE|nr:M20 family metallopeptidase [Paracrocinitomix mangrovi]UKN01870.1 M20 family metallopeptidase [Paracrocinitomix mangrovi]